MSEALTHREPTAVDTFSEFLTAVAPGKRAVVAHSRPHPPQGIQFIHQTEAIQLYCGHPTCGRIQFFEPDSSRIVIGPTIRDFILRFTCRNCRRTNKIYSIYIEAGESGEKMVFRKFGEIPAFGPHVPARTLRLIQGGKDYFLQGLRCETQGLGVGAFVYYRRVVENQKNQIFDEIIRVGKHISADPQLISEIELAKKEIQFTNAVEVIKHGFPQSLLINGHNPLTLLHSALSIGVHNLADEQCLEQATSVRIVLTEFAERLAQAMKDEAELNDAVNRLARKRQPAALPTILDSLSPQGGR